MLFAFLSEKQLNPAEALDIENVQNPKIICIWVLVHVKFH
jgi:hypothetical protein